jgi:hypothetical protein
MPEAMNENKLIPETPDMADVDPLDEDNLDGPMVQGWQCDDDGKAEWCIAQLRDAKATIDMWEAHYKEQFEKIKTREQHRIDVMTTYLRRYLISQREQGLTKSTKTTDKYSLPSGVLTLKRGGWDYTRNEQELVEWLRHADMGDYIKETVKYTPMWGELKKLTKTDDSGNVVLAETGEIINGVKAVMAPDSFKIE